MSDYNRFNPFSGQRGEGGGMEGQLQRNYQQQQQPQEPQFTPEQQYIGNLAADPQMAAMLAQQVRERMAGQQQQQQQPPSNPHQDIEDDIARIQASLNAAMELPPEQRDYARAQEIHQQLLSRRQDLVEARIRYNDQQRAQSDRRNEARNVYIQFTTALIGSLDDGFVASMNTTKPQIGEEFKNYVTSRYNVNELSDPTFLNRILPDLWKAFAFERQLPAPGQAPYGQPQSMRQDYAPQAQQNNQPQYPYQQNQGQAPLQGQVQHGQPGNEADPLANVFVGGPDGMGMADAERAFMKAYYYDKGQYDVANRIVYRDGSPIPNRREL